MNELVHFADDNETLCGKDANLWIVKVSDHRPDELCPDCVAQFAQLKELELRYKQLETAVIEFFSCDDLWIDGLSAGYAADELKKLVS